MRLVWELSAFKLDREGLRAAIDELAARFELQWELTFSDVRPRVAVFVSKMPHCLYDLLLCHQLGEMRGDIVTVVSNHDALASVCQHFDVSFTHIPVPAEDKAAAEARQLAHLDELRVDRVVLARYMQILSPAFVARWPGKIINIHHSFLPAFVGARPYHQARERGVKVIGRPPTTSPAISIRGPSSSRTCAGSATATRWRISCARGGSWSARC
jgi:formyltetrahydrofolate deformylase